ncbi:hypothetical protein BGZ68_000524, partial [Mortierella alpina]
SWRPPGDFELLMNARLEAYDAALKDPVGGEAERDAHFATLRSKGLNKWTKDVHQRTASDLQHLRTKYTGPTSRFTLQQLSSQIVPAEGVQDDGFYDPVHQKQKALQFTVLVEFLNVWFFLMQEPYASSDMLTTTSIQRPSRRADQLAYLMWYKN